MKCLKDGFLHHVRAIKWGLTPSIFFVNQLINLYSKHCLFREARTLFDEMPERNVFSWNAIISAYVRREALGQARDLFDSASLRDSISYNALLSGYVNVDGYEGDAVDLFVKMQRESDGIRIDECTITTMLNLFAKLGSVCYGIQLHAYAIKTGNDISGFAITSLVDMYSKCGYFEEALRAFDGCRNGVVAKNAVMAACCREGDMGRASKIFEIDPELNDTVSWNTMISGYAQNGYFEESLKFFVNMTKNGVDWNEQSFSSVLRAGTGLKSLKLGKEIHAWVLKKGLCHNPFISSGIIDVYSKCGSMEYAKSMHSLFGMGNLFSTASMIVGYSSQGHMVEARRLFDSLSEKSLIVWTAMFSGYIKAQNLDSAFELLREFIAMEEVPPDSLILVNVLGACSLEASLNPGKQIHTYVLRNRIRMDKKMASAIIDMYSKCGSIGYAEKVFGKIIERDSVIYNVMIAGYAHHGHVSKAIELFEEMLSQSLTPDNITFLALLSACRHRGLVDLGEKYFKSMTQVHDILPGIDHYTCMIDLYGRSNQLDKAVELMKEVRTEEDLVILGAFLNACMLNQNATLAKEIEERLLQTEGCEGDRYVQLANVYAAESNWEEMVRVRNHMKGLELKKTAGCSWVYLDNKVHIFTSSDVTHLRKRDIFSMLDFLTRDLHDECFVEMVGM